MTERTFEEIDAGASFTGPETAVRREDFETFGRITRDTAPIHYDDEFARNSVFGGVVAHGLFGLSLMAGLKGELHLHGSNALASLGWNNVRFAMPIFPESRVHVRATVLTKRPSRKAGQGVVNYRVELLDADENCLVEGEHVLLVARSQPAPSET